MANPKAFEAAYMKVVMNLLVAVNLSTRQLPSDVYIAVITVEPTGKASVFCLKLHACRRGLWVYKIENNE